MKYYHAPEVHNEDSAKEVVPYLINLFHPKSVIDVGCGLGDWLKVFSDNGILDVFGTDAVDADTIALMIPSEKYHQADLCSPLPPSRKYDLALCLEVVEHLPASCADQIVETLSNLSDTIIFSAAIPGQGGQNHLNEQPPTYWESLFQKKGFYFYDILRPVFWNNEMVKWWYRQNFFVVSKSQLRQEMIQHSFTNMYVHPELYEHLQKKIMQMEKNPGIKISSKLLWKALKNKLLRLYE